MASLTLGFLPLILLTGIPGADFENTVNIIIAPKGESVTISCHYEDRNETGVKYWCRGYYWGSCTTVVRTDSPQNSGVFIQDDAIQLVFTVTVKNLMVNDSDYYWCGVETDGDPAAEESFLLLVRDPKRVSGENWIEVQEGGSVVITDHYENMYRTYDKFWCAGHTWDRCTTIVRANSEKGDVSVRDDRNRQVFTVALKNVKAGNFGPYWSGISTHASSVIRASFYLQVTHASYSLTTVKTMDVQKGGSVTIPCVYGDRYETNVKYWCKISDSHCLFKVRTDSPQRKGKVSITDDPVRRFFTVTLENLTNEDSSFYQCGVETSKLVDTAFLYLSVIDGTPELMVDKQEVTGVEGETVTVQCHYGNNRSPKKWCKIGGSCVARNSGTLDSRAVQMTDDTEQKIMRVTMEGLEMNDTGWYWCGTHRYQVPVRISVTENTKTTKISTMLNNFTPEGKNDIMTAESGFFRFRVPLILLMTLGVLVLLTIILVSWKVWIRKKEARATDQERGKTRSSSTESPELQYEVINTSRSAPQPLDDYAEDVTYTSVVFSNSGEPTTCPSHQHASVPADEVIYSAVVQEHR